MTHTPIPHLYELHTLVQQQVVWEHGVEEGGGGGVLRGLELCSQGARRLEVLGLLREGHVPHLGVNMKCEVWVSGRRLVPSLSER